jgi:cysteinyl-tRNA synthetase
MGFRFYNSYTRKLEDFKPQTPGQVKIYSCGPTVYDFAHIGNFRSYVFSDILRRSLKLGGYTVYHAMNITDVDDKTIKRTLDQNSDKKTEPDIDDLKRYTDVYTKAFFDDIKKIGIAGFDVYPHATDYMKEMISLVENLEAKNLAYRLDGSVYFPISRYADYGKLSGVDLSSVKSGARYNADEYTKEDVRDFVLWKSEKEHEKIAWDSPFGRGRPGWHLECSAMIHSIFNGEIDIHTGGVDLMFPHHENEIAQSVNAYEHGFVHYWMHCEHLLVDSRKMSKSEGNFYTLRDLIDKGYHPFAIRYFLLSSHYSQKINFTMDALDQVASTLRKINNFYKRLNDVKGNTVGEIPENEKNLLELLPAWKSEFLADLEDNLNTPRALAVLHNAIKTANGFLDECGDVVTQVAKDSLNEIFHEFNSVFNLVSPELADAKIGDEAPTEILELLAKRNEARKQKNYAMSDKMRDQIHEAGYVIVDTPQGSELQKKSS